MIKKIVKFYDTCSLLLLRENFFDNQEYFAISSVTIQELENIKTAYNKDAEIKYSARLLLHLLDNYENYFTLIHTIDNEQVINNFQLEITNDSKILSDAIKYREQHTDEEIVFVTNDLCLKQIAHLFFDNEHLDSVEEETDNYTGYETIVASEQDLTEFYSDPTQNYFNLYTNEYLIVKNDENEIIDLRIWDGEKYDYLKYHDFDSMWFGKIKPYENDPYQKMLFDSLCRNQFTVIRGKPGSGKSYLGLGYLFYLLDKNKIDKIVIFCNPVAARDFAKLGFYPGDKNTKLLDSQIGNFLACKLGDIAAAEQLIQQNRLLLIPGADCRGVDISENCGVYITEAQNTSIDMMKLLVQRIGENCPVIIEGDDRTQVDLISYSSSNNGLKRLSQIFRGQNYYGEVKLQNCHRSKIAERAELM